MSKRKGLSHEEKRQKMMDLFYEKKDFFQLKELERLGPKEKGVISQSVKDIVQSLVDDGLVDTDKIGTCVYFWAFPRFKRVAAFYTTKTYEVYYELCAKYATRLNHSSKASNVRLNKTKDLEQKLNEIDNKLENIKKKLDEAKVGREETSEREEALDRLSSVQRLKEELEVQFQNYRDCHPDLLRRLSDESKIAVEAVNRWTDNIFCIRSWCRNKFFIEEATLNKQFNVPEDLDYI